MLITSDYSWNRNLTVTRKPLPKNQQNNEKPNKKKINKTNNTLLVSTTMDRFTVPPNQLPLVKIVATLGPATSKPDVLERLFVAGVNVVRYNFSHGEQHDKVNLNYSVRAISQRLRRDVATIVDLQGPKIRCNPFIGNSMPLIRGTSVTIRAATEPGHDGVICTKFKPIVDRCKIGDPILLDDGLMRLEVTAKGPDGLVCKVIQGGVIKNHKGINLPQTDLGELPALTPKDIDDAKFALKCIEPDFIALSFVRRPQDILELRQIITESGKHAKIIAKLEKPEAIDNLDDILSVCDAVMVARGDLGVEVGNDKVPELQKLIIRKCIERGIPVITATQMLESMTNNPTCTRAEASDVANAVWDGTDAVMLSGETAMGEFPIETVSMMRKIILQAEQFLAVDTYTKRGFDTRSFDARLQKDITGTTLGFSLGRAACQIAAEVNASAFACVSDTGNSAIRVASARPMLPIFVFTNSIATVRRVSLVRGCFPFLWQETPADEFDNMDNTLRASGHVQTGQAVVYTTKSRTAEQTQATTNSCTVRFL
ncbi:pyruvate kinase [Pelomyxa schiedti]|nr:pyruvate kinase [Pelomyxa schiedti]